MYLSVKKSVEKRRPVLFLSHLSHQNPQASIFKPEIIKRNAKSDDIQSLRFIDSDATIYLKYSNPDKEFSECYLECRKPLSSDGYSTTEASLSMNPRENMAVRIVCTSPLETHECNFLLSCRPFVQKYLTLLNEFDRLRMKETESDLSDLIYYVLKINSLYQNMCDCVEILTKYADNTIMVESSKFNRDLVTNRRKVLSDLGFMETFCAIVDCYYDYHDLEKMTSQEEKVAEGRESTYQGTLLTEDLEKQTRDQLTIEKMVGRYYQRYLRQGRTVLAKINVFLQSFVRNHKENQAKLFSNIHTFQKHFFHLDESLDLALVMIEDNRVILEKISQGFFESLSIIKDILMIKDRKKHFQVDLEIKDEGENLYIGDYSEEMMKDTKIKDGEDQAEDSEMEELRTNPKSNRKTRRPASLLVYLLVLLVKGVRRPVILKILSASCMCNGKSFVPNQENFIQLFTDNNELIQLFLSDLRMSPVKAVPSLVTRFEEEENFVVLKPCFKNKKIVLLNEVPRILLLTEQINFYSTLCNGRNLIWKNFLSVYFPQEDLLNEIIEPAYSNGNLL